jgi:hypothetical protein
MAERPILSVRLDPETIERLNDAAERRGHAAGSLARHLIKRGIAPKPVPEREPASAAHYRDVEAA